MEKEKCPLSNQINFFLSHIHTSTQLKCKTKQQQQEKKKAAAKKKK